ncbi:MAG: tRNA (adenosine(37)-N6)-threonylcarbamoyltransferase complex dimerization subunit type 1 TsaB [Candidatus Saccharimonadales bacterium]
MLILTIRTDRPEAEIGLYEDSKKLAYETWQAHRQLAETIHVKIENLLKSLGKDWPDLEATICYQGPGSFTGLRIGLTVANTLAYGLEIPIIATKNDNWANQGIEKLLAGKNDQIALPDYGAPPHITNPKK